MEDSLTQESQENIVDQAQNAWEIFLVDEALEVLKRLEEEKEISKSLDEDQLKELKTKMQWVAFAALSDRIQLDLIENHLLLPLRDKSFDLENVFYLKRLGAPFGIWPDKHVPAILNALLKNEEKIGERPLVQTVPGAGNENLPPYVGNWLKNYSKLHGMDKHDKLTVLQYMANSPNAQALSPEDKKILERLLLLFEEIKVPSLEQTAKEIEKFKKNAGSSEAQTSAPGEIPLTSSGATQPKIVNFSKTAGDILNNQGNTVLKPLEELMQSYPKIINQKITSTPISILGREGRFEPTIQHWLLDYRTHYGVDEHSDEERKSFLFSSPNTKGLSDEDRRRLSLVLESYDKKTPLSVSKESSELVF